MLEWGKAFLTRYGLGGGAILVALALAWVLVKFVDLHPLLVGAEPNAQPVTQAQMAEHVEQMRAMTELNKAQIETLREINRQLKQNHATQAIASRLICLRLSKNDEQRDKCVTEIQ